MPHRSCCGAGAPLEVAEALGPCLPDEPHPQLGLQKGVGGGGQAELSAAVLLVCEPWSWWCWPLLLMPSGVCLGAWHDMQVPPQHHAFLSRQGVLLALACMHRWHDSTTQGRPQPWDSTRHPPLTSSVPSAAKTWVCDPTTMVKEDTCTPSGRPLPRSTTLHAAHTR